MKAAVVKEMSGPFKIEVELYRRGRFPFDRMISFYPFDQISKAVEDMEKGKVIKPVLRP